ncbi:MAG: ATP-binding protein, partial [Salinivirgaceae bacterium]|nr:ATP-binding protein [Salinivirgaceae bacterium]
KRAVVQSLYQKIYLGDICARNNIRNSKVMGLVVRKLAESVKQPTSYNRIQNIIKSIGYNATVTTVSEYINYAVDAWLVLPIENGFAKMSERESVKKYYFIDNGILNLFLFDSDTALLENMVAIALCRKYGRENVTFLKSNIEIDFYVEQEKLAIQVSYSITDFDTRERETRSLFDFVKKHSDTKLLIITKEESEKIVNGDISITVLPILEWLENL